MITQSLAQQAARHHATRALDLLDTYWRRLAAHGGLPQWSAVDPGAIQDALDHAFLAERYGHCHARIRTAGGAIAEAAGTDCAGFALSLLVCPEGRSAFNDALSACCENRDPVALDITTVHGSRAKIVLYPLIDRSGRVTQLLGGLALRNDGQTVPSGVTSGSLERPRAPNRRPELRLVIDNT